MKLRLFTLRNTRTGATTGQYFASKPEAKRARDKANETAPTLYVVTPGPDHHKSAK